MLRLALVGLGCLDGLPFSPCRSGRPREHGAPGASAFSGPTTRTATAPAVRRAKRRDADAPGAPAVAHQTTSRECCWLLAAGVRKRGAAAGVPGGSAVPARRPS